MKQAEKAYKSHKSDVEELETELRAAERRRDEYEEMTASESKEQGRNLQLEGMFLRADSISSALLVGLRKEGRRRRKEEGGGLFSNSLVELKVWEC